MTMEIRRGLEMELWKEFEINVPGKGLNQIVRVYRQDIPGSNKWTVLFRFVSNMKAENYKNLCDWNIDFGTSPCMPKLTDINKERKRLLRLVIDEFRGHWK